MSGGTEQVTREPVTKHFVMFDIAKKRGNPMSEPVVLYCLQQFDYGAARYQRGDTVTLASPSTVRDFLATGAWTREFVAKEEKTETAPPKPAGKKRGKP